MSQKHACDEFNDLNWDENLWKTQTDHNRELENSIDNNYNELHQISLEVHTLESSL
jgi:hypothetical protein